MTVFDSRDVRIRKPCRCWGCARLLPVGVLVQKCSGIDDGRWRHSNWCVTCQRIWNREMSYGDTLDYGEFRASDPHGWEWDRIAVEEQVA